MKLRYPVLLLVLAAGAGAALWWWLGDDESQGPPPRYAEARRGDLAVEITATGTVEPEYVIEIKSKASGTIQAIHVEPGSVVAQDDLLIEIDPVMEQRRVTQAEAELTMAQAQRSSVSTKLDFLRTQVQRDEALRKKGLVAQADLDQLRKEYAVMRGESQVAEAQLLRAKESAAEAQDRLAETKIKAPSAGTILERHVSPGMVVTAGTAQGGQTLLTMADLSRLFVRVQVDEADVAKIEPEQKARVTSDALPGVIFLGKVLRVAPMGRQESSVTVFDVVVELTGQGKHKLRPMLTANVFIQVGEVKNALLVPRAAVQQQGAIAVVVVPDKGPQRVKLGLTDDQVVEILSGIEEGTQVLLPGARRSGGEGAAAGQAGRSTVPGMGGMGGGRRGMRL